MKVSLFLPDDMYNRVRVECEKRNLKTSQFIQQALEHEFNTLDAESAIKELLGGIDPEDVYAALNALPLLNENLKVLREIQNNPHTNRGVENT